MKSWIRSLCGTVMVLLFLVLSAFGADPTEKKRVALFDFEFGAVHRWWSWDWDIGKGIADMVVTNLVRDGTYSVVERKQLDRILAVSRRRSSRRPATATLQPSAASETAMLCPMPLPPPVTSTPFPLKSTAIFPQPFEIGSMYLS